MDKKYQLKSVDFLLGTTTKINDVIVLGMLTQVSTNSYIHGKCIIASFRSSGKMSFREMRAVKGKPSGRMQVPIMDSSSDTRVSSLRGVCVWPRLLK